MSSKQKKTVYFVRHGQSVDNVSPVIQSIHSPLSEVGKQQAENIANVLSHVSFELLIASPVKRAKQTAEYIAEKTKKDIVFSELFVERIKPSEIDGKPWEDKEAESIWRKWNESLCTPGSRVSDGENYDDIVERVDKALAYLEARQESNIVVVTHGYFLRTIVARVLLGEELNGATMKRLQEHAYIENTAITVIEYRDSFERDFDWHLMTLNDQSHFVK